MTGSLVVAVPDSTTFEVARFLNILDTSSLVRWDTVESFIFISGDEQSGGIFQWSRAGDAAIPHHQAWLGADVRRAIGGLEILGGQAKVGLFAS